MVMEGVHLVPGLLPPEVEGALIVQVVVEIADAEVHRMHFHVRDASTGGIRALAKYLERLEDIRRIQTYVVAEHALERGKRVVLAANELVGHGVDDALAALAPARAAR